MIVMPGAWRCELHGLWTTSDCPDCDADLISLTEDDLHLPPESGNPS